MIPFRGPSFPGRSRLAALLGVVVLVGAPSGPARGGPGPEQTATAVEDGRTRTVRVEPWTLPVPAALGESTIRLLAPDSTGVAGRILFPDRGFDAAGYDGTSTDLLSRHTLVEIRTTDSLLVRGTTDDVGRFSLRWGAGIVAADLIVRSVAVSAAGDTVRVVDAAGVAHELLRIAVPSDAGLELVLGDVVLADDSPGSAAGIAHLLDLSGSTLDMVVDELGPWPGPVPVVRFDPSFPDAATGLLNDQVVISSPAAGDSDVWSDGRVLAAWGAAWVRALGGTAPPALDFEEGVTHPAAAFRRAAAWTLAGLVQAWRAEWIVDAQGDSLTGSPSLLVDLPTPPPPGFVAPSEGALDLEAAEIGPDRLPVLPRGQRSSPAVAALLHDAGDDDSEDPAVGDRQTLLQTLRNALTVPGAVHEEFHDLWVDLQGDPDGAFAAWARDRAGCALEIDVHEPDGAPEPAPFVEAWVQPEPTGPGRVVVTEVFVGERDGVELTNVGAQPVDLTGWTIRAARNGFSNTAARTTTIPGGFRLAPGRSVLVLEGTPASATSPFDLPAPEWNAPWAAGADGAVTLRDAANVPKDFVRWDGSQVSSTPIPAGTGFSGSIDAPADERFTLARDSLGTDTDTATDFAPRRPTPGWPNVDGARIHTLRPRGDVDRLRIGGDGAVEVHARRTRDTGIPALAVGAAAASTGPGIGADDSGAVAAVLDTTTIALSAAPGASTSTGVDLFVWRPFHPLGLFPVVDVDVDLATGWSSTDSVTVGWTAASGTDSVRVWENGTRLGTFAAAQGSVTVVRSLGSYLYRVAPVANTVAGTARESGVFVGPTPCGVRNDFLSALQGGQESPPQFFMALDEPASTDGGVIRDRRSTSPTYADADTARISLLSTVWLNPGSRVTIEHAVHLAGDGDRARLFLSTDDGVTWTELRSWTGLEHTGAAGDPADWTDGVLTPGDFVSESIGLEAWAGERVRLRLERTSDASGNDIGWTVDTLSVELGRDEGEYWVGTGGDDTFGCGLRGRPWRTPARAAVVAVAGDAIVLEAGRFEPGASTDDASLGPLVVDLPVDVELRGAGSDRTTLVVPAGAVGVRASRSRLADLRIEGGRVAAWFGAAVVELDSMQIDRADTAIVSRQSELSLRRTVLAQSGVGLHGAATFVEFDGCTLADLGVGVVSTDPSDFLRFDRSLVVRCDEAIVRAEQVGTTVEFVRGGWRDVGAAYVGVVPQLVGPLLSSLARHCDVASADYRLAIDSDYVDVPGVGLVGARGPGCVAPVATAVPMRGPGLVLRAPAPNPFNPRTSIVFEVPRDGRVVMDVIDVRGRRVRELVDTHLQAGAHRVVWNGDDTAGRSVGSGVYFVRLEADGEQRVVRAVLVR